MGRSRQPPKEKVEIFSTPDNNPACYEGVKTTLCNARLQLVKINVHATTPKDQVFQLWQIWGSEEIVCDRLN